MQRTRSCYGEDMSTAARGRPRSEPSRLKSLAAARDLLQDGDYEQLTMAAIAARAGVGKQTLYRWWPSKAELVAECVVEGVVPFELIVATTSGDAVAALHSWLVESFRRLAEPGSVALMRAMTAAAASNESARLRMVEQFDLPIRRSVDAALQAGIAAGQIRADVSTASVADLLVGTMMYSLFDDAELDEARADSLIRTITGGILRSPDGN